MSDKHKLNSWKIEKLASLCEVFADGDWVESKDQSVKGVRLIQTGNVGNGMFKDRIGKARYVSEETLKRLHCAEIFEGDCLVSRLPDPVGRSCILPNTGEKMITVVDCTIIRFNKTKIRPDFFNYYSQSAQYLNDVDRETSGTTRKRISRSRLAEINIPIPPLSEQQRIVALLDKAFEEISKTEANISRNLTDEIILFESVIENYFVNKSDEHRTGKLSEFCDIKHGYAFDGKYFKTDFSGDNPIILTPGNFSEKGRLYFSERNTKRYFGECPKDYTLNKGDLVVVMTDLSSQMKILGKPAFIQSENILHNQRIGRFVFFTDDLEKSYLYYFLKTKSYQKKIKDTATGTMVRHTAPKRILDNIISFPSIEKQRVIAAKLEFLSTKIEKLEKIYQSKLVLLSDFKKSILTKAFSGEL